MNGVLECLLPFGRHIRQALVNNLGRLQRSIKVLEARDSYPVHPFKIELDAFLGDIAIHPVPPNPRAC